MDQFNKALAIILLGVSLYLLYTSLLVGFIAIVLTAIVVMKINWSGQKIVYERQPIPQWVKDEVLMVQHNCCSYCNVPFTSPHTIEFHHIKPVAQGGKSDNPFNISAIHGDCHNMLTRGRNY